MSDVDEVRDLGIGQQMLDLIVELFPMPRSITGEGVRETLRALQRIIPLDIHEVPTGTPVLDWTVPREWVIRDAFIKDRHGDRIVDFQASNLHVVGYSTPVHARMTLTELAPHLHSLPDRPTFIPWRTSYYREDWGFCLAHEVLTTLDEGPYEVVIDSELRDGSLTYGELVIPGGSRDEILVSAHICHPSMANDNLSGIAVATYLAAHLRSTPSRHTIRFLFGPGTIGSLTWLGIHQHDLRVRHGLVLAGLGDNGSLTYKRSQQGDATIDRAVGLAVRDEGAAHAVQDFSPWGYDERQYNSPGFALPVGLLMRTPHGTYPEYHTSADDLGFIQAAKLEESLRVCVAIIDILNGDQVYMNQNPKGEPQLGRRGLYAPIGGSRVAPDQLAMLWVLNQSDGTRSLIDIAERSGRSFASIAEAATSLSEAGLLVAQDAQ